MSPKFNFGWRQRVEDVVGEACIVSAHFASSCIQVQRVYAARKEHAVGFRDSWQTAGLLLPCSLHGMVHPLAQYVGAVFSSPTTLNGSFLPTSPPLLLPPSLYERKFLTSTQAEALDQSQELKEAVSEWGHYRNGRNAVSALSSRLCDLEYAQASMQ